MPARRALQLAVEQELPLAELECLGLRERIINCLEKAEILTVKDVVQCWDRVEKIRNIGPLALKEILDALSNIHLLEEKRVEYVAKLMPNYSSVTRDKLYPWNQHT
jgi:DNA-directed RNA polymerase alpha subunit